MLMQYNGEKVQGKEAQKCRGAKAQKHKGAKVKRHKGAKAQSCKGLKAWNFLTSQHSNSQWSSVVFYNSVVL